MSYVSKGEKGIYGLITANEAKGYLTGTDLLGEEVSEDSQGLNGGLSLAAIVGAGRLVRSGNVGIVSGRGNDNAKLSPSNYPNPDPPMSVPPVRYEPKTIEEVIRMRQGKGPTTKMTHGDKNIEAHHRQQVPVKNGGILDELEQSTHRGGGNHTRHDKPSQLTPSQRAKEIREHYKERGKEYILPGEGI